MRVIKNIVLAVIGLSMLGAMALATDPLGPYVKKTGDYMTGNLTVWGKITGQGTIESQAFGYKFPDGTNQTTASTITSGDVSSILSSFETTASLLNRRYIAQFTNEAYIGAVANPSGFTAARLIVSESDTGVTTGNYPAAVFAETKSNAVRSSAAVWGVGKTYGSNSTNGILGQVFAATSEDTGTAFGVAGFAGGTHVGGDNVAVSGYAVGGKNNYSFQGTGDIQNTGNLKVTGVATASAYYGSGANLTGILSSDALSTFETKAEFQAHNNVVQEPSGFQTPESVGVSYDPTSRRITLTGDITAYYKGVAIPSLVSGYVSPTHDATAGTWFLSYKDGNIAWSQTPWKFYDVQIAYVYYGAQQIGFQETHGFMQWQTHKELHDTIGTHLNSGADISGTTNGSTTPTARRPLISTAEVDDEDLRVTVPQVSNSSYVHYSLFGASAVGSFEVASSEIVSVLADNPYYNQFTSGAWKQTLMPNNSYQAVWLVALPVASDSGSQQYRYIWVQGQSQSGTLSVIQGLIPASLNLGTLASIAPEIVFVQRVIIRYTGGNWVITQSDKLTGNKFNQTASPSGSFLSAVSTDTSLTGDGTIISPLGVSSLYNTIIADSTQDAISIGQAVGTLEAKSNKGIAGGYATLDAFGKVPTIESYAVGGGSGAWGGITGTITAQADLINIFNTFETIADLNTKIKLDNVQYNTLVGFNAGANRTLGAVPQSNTFVGYESGKMAVGASALAEGNVGLGSNTLYSLTGGAYNMAIGGNGQYATTTGKRNTSIGHMGLVNNIQGDGNIAIGYAAGAYATGTNEVYINSIDRGTTAAEKTDSIIYGVQNATAANQQLTVNAGLTVSQGLSVAGNSLVVNKATNRVGVGTREPWCDLALGNQTSSAVTTPECLSLGGTYATNVNMSSAKLKLYDAGGTTAYGIGVSSANMFFGSSSNVNFSWIVSDSLKMKLTELGQLCLNTTDAYARISIGNRTDTSATTPESISLGATYASTDNYSSCKLKLYDDGGANVFGIGAASGIMSFHVNTNTIFKWANNNVEKMRLSSSGQLGVGTSAPTATIHIKAGTSTAGTAPLKFTTGTNLTTAEQGAFEFDTNNLYFSRFNGTREVVPTITTKTTSAETGTSEGTFLINTSGNTFNVYVDGAWRNLLKW